MERAGVEQAVYPLPHGQFPVGMLARDVRLAAHLLRQLDPPLYLFDLRFPDQNDTPAFMK
jgi:hypothetical protein